MAPKSISELKLGIVQSTLLSIYPNTGSILHPRNRHRVLVHTPVYVVTVSNDAIFCNPAGLPGAGTCTPDNGTNYLAETASLYLAASVFDSYIVPSAGHCWQFYHSAAATFVNVHQWLAGQGF